MKVVKKIAIEDDKLLLLVDGVEVELALDAQANELVNIAMPHLDPAEREAAKAIDLLGLGCSAIYVTEKLPEDTESVLERAMQNAGGKPLYGDLLGVKVQVLYRNTVGDVAVQPSGGGPIKFVDDFALSNLRGA